MCCGVGCVQSVGGEEAARAVWRDGSWRSNARRVALLGLGLALLAALAGPLALRLDARRAARADGDARWGVCAVHLGPALAAVPGPDLAGPEWAQAPRLTDWWRRAGLGPAVAPTTAALAWDQAALYLAFDCAEPTPGWRARRTNLLYDPRTGFPDRLEIHVARDQAGPVHNLVVDADGGHTERVRPARWWYVEDREVTGDALRVQVEPRTEGGWRAMVSVPWAALGVAPGQPLWFMVTRCHTQIDEQTSPLAADWPLWPAESMMMEVVPGGRAAVVQQPGALVRLPSGRWLWQRPAELRRAQPADLAQITALQRRLAGPRWLAPTHRGNFASRCRLAEIWYEQLLLDGYSFFGLDVPWVPREGEYHPHEARCHIARRLAMGDWRRARATLDTFLRQLDRATRQWYASGSLLDAAGDRFVRATRLARTGEAEFALTAGGRELALRAELTELDGVRGWRLVGLQAGEWSAAPLDLRATDDESGRVWAAADGRPGPTLAYREAGPAIEIISEGGEVAWRVTADQIGVRWAGDGSLAAVDLRQPLATGEAVVGLGERFDALDQRGKSFAVWGEDVWDGTMRGVANQSYKPLPLLHTSQLRSLFWATPYRLRADLGVAQPDVMRLSARGPILDWWLWAGSPQAAVRAQTALTGRALVPPRWAFEPWMGGSWRRWDQDPSAEPAAALLAAADGYAARNIPTAAAYLEMELSAERELYAALAARDLRPIAWADTNLDRTAQHDGLGQIYPRAKRPYLKRAGGEQTTFIDFSSPHVDEFLARAWGPRLAWGLAGAMIDYGDVLPLDAQLVDGRDGEAAHNVYGRDYAAAYHRLFRAHRGDDFVLMLRPMAPGSQQYGVPFAGDQRGSWRGLRMLATAAGSAAASGLGLYTGDIGLYEGVPDPQVYARSLQFGAFMTLMRNHGITPREPWRYGPEVARQYHWWAWFRLSLLDTFYTAAQEARFDGRPALRPLLFDWPTLDEAWRRADQFVVGRDLLLAPGLGPAARREVWLPPGTWTDFWTGAEQTGPATVEVDLRTDRPGLWVRAGAVLPVRLPASRALGEPLGPGAEPALLVTAPMQPVSRRLWRAAGHGGELRLQPADDGWRLDLPADESARGLLLVGPVPAEVRVGGRVVATQPAALGRWVPLGASGAARRVEVRR